MSRTSRMYILAQAGDHESFLMNSGHCRVYSDVSEATKQLNDLKDMVIDHYEGEEHRKISPGDDIAVYELEISSVRRIEQ